MSLKAGDVVGTYEVIGSLGSGGMASVFRVRHAVLGSEHALKVLRSDLVEHPQVRARFLDEGRVQAQLRHPGIVRVTGIVSEPGVAGLVMDLLVGTSLEDRVEQGAMPVEQAAGWLMHALHAVGFAHSQGVIHRDLKPSNLFLVDGDPLPTLKVLDFGIAKVSGRGQTRAGGTLGTYGFMAPEQIKDSSVVDPRADIFALGAVLYELVTGRAAFEGDTDYQLMQNVLNGRYDPDLLPPTLVPVVDCALSVELEDRYVDCGAFSDALRDLATPELVRAFDTTERASFTSELASLQAPTTFDHRPVTVDAVVEPVSVAAPRPQAPAVTLEPTAIQPSHHDTVVRVAGAAQIMTGLINTFVMWLVACYGAPKVLQFGVYALGMPGILRPFTLCGGVLGFGLLIVGPIEVWTGVRAQLYGVSAAAAVRRTAIIQLVALVFGGIPSFLVGCLITALFLVDPVSKEEA